MTSTTHARSRLTFGRTLIRIRFIVLSPFTPLDASSVGKYSSQWSRDCVGRVSFGTFEM